MQFLSYPVCLHMQKKPEEFHHNMINIFTVTTAITYLEHGRGRDACLWINLQTSDARVSPLPALVNCHIGIIFTMKYMRRPCISPSLEIFTFTISKSKRKGRG